MRRQYVRNPDCSLELTRSKTENSVGQVSIPQAAVELLIQEHENHPFCFFFLYKYFLKFVA